MPETKYIETTPKLENGLNNNLVEKCERFSCWKRKMFNDNWLSNDILLANLLRFTYFLQNNGCILEISVRPPFKPNIHCNICALFFCELILLFKSQKDLGIQMLAIIGQTFCDSCNKIILQFMCALEVFLLDFLLEYHRNLYLIEHFVFRSFAKRTVCNRIEKVLYVHLIKLKRNNSVCASLNGQSNKNAE